MKIRKEKTMAEEYSLAAADYRDVAKGINRHLADYPYDKIIHMRKICKSTRLLVVYEADEDYKKLLQMMPEEEPIYE